MLGELDRVADEVDKHLFEPQRIADQVARHLAFDMHHQLEPFGMGADPERRANRIGDGFEVERGLLEAQPAAFDFRQIQDVVDQRDQRVAVGLHHGEIVSLLIVERCLAQ